MPLVKREQGVRRTVLAGVGYGTLAAATVAPERFGNVLSMSGSFWWAPEGAETEGPPSGTGGGGARLPLRVSLSAGRYETARECMHGILETTRELLTCPP